MICTHSKTNSDDKINNSDELIVLPSTTWSSQARAARDPLQERSLPGDEWRRHFQVRGGSWKVRLSTMITIGEDNNDNDQNHDADNNHVCEHQWQDLKIRRFAIASRDIVVGEVLCVEKAIVSHMLPEYMVIKNDVDVEFVVWQQELK